jgi:hypothetical protein
MTSERCLRLAIGKDLGPGLLLMLLVAATPSCWDWACDSLHLALLRLADERELRGGRN